MHKLCFALVVALCANACTWVALEQTGAGVRVAADDESLARCSFRGDITVTVTNRVAGIERNSIKVADELETLARNEAATLNANTVQPKGRPAGGEQSFSAWSCP